MTERIPSDDSNATEDKTDRQIEHIEDIAEVTDADKKGKHPMDTYIRVEDPANQNTF